MIDLKEISRIGSKALAWNSKPNDESFPELPEVLVRILLLLRHNAMYLVVVVYFVISFTSSFLYRFGSDSLLLLSTALTWDLAMPHPLLLSYKLLTCSRSSQ